MRTSFLSALILGTTTLVAARSWFDDPQKPLDEEPLPVPGDNPLVYCTNPETYILNIEDVNVLPNPPQAGHNLTIYASGYLTERVEEGAKVHLQVKYGLITILNQNLELCDYAGQVDLTCPLDKGDLTFEKVVNLPKEIPQGKYTASADVYTKDDKKITCLTATINFTTS